MKDKFRIGFWNYVDTGVLEEEAAADDWKALGMNMPMSFEFDPEKHDKKRMIAQLDACEQRGMKLIVCDARTTFSRYIQVGEEAFRKGVEQAARDFASHPAFFGFHVGDEPGKDQWEAAERAYIACRELSPVMPFINFLPYWDEENFKDVLGVDCEGYGEKIKSFLRRTGAQKFGYDYYGQCAYFERERFVNLYFKNLNIFGGAARSCGADLYVSLLSVGHWSLVVPDEDLLRWQISTTVAHGAAGILWFFVYERRLDGSFRLSPIDLFWEKTETFGRLSRQNRTFNEYYAEFLSSLSFGGVWHLGKSFGSTPAFSFNEDLREIRTVVNPAPLSVTKFEKDGQASWLLVNLSQNEPTCIDVTCGENLSQNSGRYWLAPGQMLLLKNKSHPG